jgi:hypothetical protein
MDCSIADELIAMAELDQKVADELATSGALYEGYDPRMAAIHEKNASRLQAIMAQIGWPTERLVLLHSAPPQPTPCWVGLWVGDFLASEIRRNVNVATVAER